MARLRSAARAERAAAVALAVVLLVVGGALEAAAAAAPTSCTVAPGIRFPGNDLTKAAAATAADCCTLCTAQPNCTLWTWNSSPNGDGGSPTCFMKHGGGRASSDPNCTSGTKSGPLPPIPAPTPPPSPAVCRPVARPPPSKRGPPPLGRLPNFVTLLVDDLGFDDLRSHDVNAGESLTPNVEGLLKEAITLDRHHTYMWCSPTRRSFITGRYPVHITGLQAPTASNLTPLQVSLLSEKLAVAGYQSHFIGKGHLGWQTTDHLLVNRGFETHVGYLGGSQNYDWGGGSPEPFVGKHDMWHNHGPGFDIVPEIYYSTEFYSNYAVERIEGRNASRPLWIHVAYQAMHGGGSRGNVPSQDAINLTTIGFRNQDYGNALRSLDNGIANVTAVLKREGLWENTLVLIWADNGGDNPGGSASNYPLLGRKCLAWEGGTRVFAMATGGLIPASLHGTVNTQLMHIADWFPTLSTLAGVDPTDDWIDANGTAHPIDGVDVWPALVSGSAVPRQYLPTTPQSILYTDGTGGKMYKLITLETQAVRFHPNGTNYHDTNNNCLNATTVFDCVDAWGENGGGGRQSCYVCTPEAPCLFEVFSDPGETTNIAAANPALVQQLRAKLETFQPYAAEMALTPDNLACYNCSFNPDLQWHDYTGPGCILEPSFQ